jgi:hypothetical protein
MSSELSVEGDKNLFCDYNASCNASSLLTVNLLAPHRCACVSSICLPAPWIAVRLRDKTKHVFTMGSAACFENRGQSMDRRHVSPYYAALQPLRVTAGWCQAHAGLRSDAIRTKSGMLVL